MSTEFTHQILKVVVAQICQTIGWHAIQSTPLEVLVDTLNKYIQEIARQTHRYTELYGRTEANLDDLALAYHDLNINLEDIEEYINYVNPVECAIEVPKYPVHKESHLNFLKPGSKEVLTRPVHIHEHLPPINPEKETLIDEHLQNHLQNDLNGNDNNIDVVTISSTDDYTATQSATLFKRPNEHFLYENFTNKRSRLLLDEEGRPTREISSVMMTSSGFISPAREGKLPDAKTPISLPEINVPINNQPSSGMPFNIMDTKFDKKLKKKLSDKKKEKNLQSLNVTSLNGSTNTIAGGTSPWRDVPPYVSDEKKFDKSLKHQLKLKAKKGLLKTAKHKSFKKSGNMNSSSVMSANGPKMKLTKKQMKQFPISVFPSTTSIDDAAMLSTNNVNYPSDDMHWSNLNNVNSTKDDQQINKQSQLQSLGNIHIEGKISAEPDKQKLNIIKRISSAKSKDDINRSDSLSEPTDTGKDIVIVGDNLSSNSLGINNIKDYTSQSGTSAISIKGMKRNLGTGGGKTEKKERIKKQKVTKDKDSFKTKKLPGLMDYIMPSFANPMDNYQQTGMGMKHKLTDSGKLIDNNPMVQYHHQQQQLAAAAAAAVTGRSAESGLIGGPSGSNQQQRQLLLPFVPFPAGPGLIPKPGLYPTFNLPPGQLGGLNSFGGLIPSNQPGDIFLPFPRYNRPNYDKLETEAPIQMDKAQCNVAPFVPPSLKLDPLPSTIGSGNNSGQVINQTSVPAVSSEPIAVTTTNKGKVEKSESQYKMTLTSESVTPATNNRINLSSTSITNDDLSDVKFPSPNLLKEKSEKRKDKEHKKEKKENKIKKKKDKKERIKNKDKTDKKKEKEEKRDKDNRESGKSKKEKKEKRKEKERAAVAAALDGNSKDEQTTGIPKLTLKLGPAISSPRRADTPDGNRKITIKAVRKSSTTKESSLSSLASLGGGDSINQREPSPELARISALVTRPPKHSKTSASSSSTSTSKKQKHVDFDDKINNDIISPSTSLAVTAILPSATLGTGIVASVPPSTATPTPTRGRPRGSTNLNKQLQQQQLLLQQQQLLFQQQQQNQQQRQNTFEQNSSLTLSGKNLSTTIAINKNSSSSSLTASSSSSIQPTVASIKSGSVGNDKGTSINKLTSSSSLSSTSSSNINKNQLKGKLNKTTNGERDADGNQVWICPACGRIDDGTPMIGCDGCDAWYHWVCVGIQVPPDQNEDWYCRVCIVKKQELHGNEKKKKRKKKEKKDH